ncbi:MAG: hypothetical protein KDD35_04265 [Bdellovibrionales bacterium]|nr:hypothetical protein [Bdellovibrionales bacterium]
MQPRLKFSSKWTPFPTELLQQIKDLFAENFASYVADGQLMMEGRIYLNEVLFCLGYGKKGQLKQANFEISIEYDRNKDNIVQIIHIAVDCAASMMDQYFADQDLEFPGHWKKFDFAGRPVHIQFSTINTALEAEANRLMGEEAEEEKGLIRGASQDDLEEEELKLKISMLGLGKEDLPEKTYSTPPQKRKKSRKH